MSPNPFLATITDVMRSGTEVPAARSVSPITSGGTWAVAPATFAHHTIRYEKKAIQTIDPINVTGKNLLPEKENDVVKKVSFYLNKENVEIHDIAVLEVVIADTSPCSVLWLLDCYVLHVGDNAGGVWDFQGGSRGQDSE